MFCNSYDDREYCTLLKKATNLEWHHVPEDMLVAPSGRGMHTYAVTPCDLHNTTDWDYYQPIDHSLAMFPDHFVKNILRSKYNIPLSPPAYVLQIGAKKKMASVKLPPKVVGNFLVKAELDLAGQIKLVRELSLPLDEFNVNTLNIDGNHADENFKQIISSIHVSDFDKDKGVELSLCCSNRYNSTSFSMKPGEPIEFTAEFEPEAGDDIGYWLEWKVATNLSMVLKGTAEYVPPSEVENTLIHIAVAVLVGFSIVATILLLGVAAGILLGTFEATAEMA